MDKYSLTDLSSKWKAASAVMCDLSIAVKELNEKWQASIYDYDKAYRDFMDEAIRISKENPKVPMYYGGYRGGEIKASEDTKEK